MEIVRTMDDYNTPDWIKKMFEGWFDPCPISNGELREFDGLGDWKDKTFVNPPYSKPMVWVEKAIEESKYLSAVLPPNIVR